eukprot:jgi/Psemu1/328275/estExt_fgenesh1_pg.C_11540001
MTINSCTMQETRSDISFARTSPSELVRTRLSDNWNGRDNIPVFYNLFVSNKTKKDIPRVTRLVLEQFENLLPFHKPIYMASIGVSLNFELLQTPENPLVISQYEVGDETLSLGALWDYCRDPAHEHEAVAYIHSKGSFTNTVQNELLRRYLTHGVLSKECADAITSKDGRCNMCASRFSPVPHPHYPGNMWMARCSYVRNLADPATFEAAMDSKSVDKDFNQMGDRDDNDEHACVGTSRYSAEHWINSHPSVRPCDLDSNPGYTWNYDNVQPVEAFASNIKLAPAPRFDMQTYLKPHNGICIGYGTSKNYRENEYMSLYNERPPKDWWGHKFFVLKDGWWPNHEYSWVEQTNATRDVLIEFGWDFHTWQWRHHPFGLWAKKWDQLTKEQREPLENVLGYTEDTWNAEAEGEFRDLQLIEEAVQTYVPNLSKDRCDMPNNKTAIEPWYRKATTPGEETKPLRSLVHELDKKPAHKKRVLLIAAVPRDETHLLTLWSQLECFAEPVDHVIISAPTWGKPYVEHVMNLAETYIPHFAKKKVTIEGKYFLNDRYDVGLWCDAYKSLENGAYDEYGLINDSVFALRKFSAVFDNLEHQKVWLTSLTYSYTYKWNLGMGPEDYWVESVYRAMDRNGMNTFDRHSCLPVDDPMFCPELDDNKACIINNFEHDLAKEYPCEKVAALYPSNPVEPLGTEAWIKNHGYWRLLVDHMGFPVAKSNEPDQIGIQFTRRENIRLFQHSPMLKNCTSLIMDKLEKELFSDDLPPFPSRGT